MTGRTFTCASCGGMFIAAWSAEEAWAGARERFPELLPMNDQDFAVLCNECDARFMEWFKGLSEAEKARLRAEHERRVSR